MVLNGAGTNPRGLNVKTHGVDGLGVFVGDYEIGVEDFFVMVLYVLTNTDLVSNDPRVKFVELVKSLVVTDGWNIERDPSCKRLAKPATATKKRGREKKGGRRN